MGALLIILQIIGAIPEIIEALTRIWEFINAIRDRKIRSEMKMQHRALVFGAMGKAFKNRSRKMSADQQADMKISVYELEKSVKEVLINQGRG